MSMLLRQDEEVPPVAPTGVTVPLRRPEVLAPAGSPEMMRAAIENGADAVFFGVEAFNARLRAHNFRVEDLPQIMAMLHERGLRGYVTLNTLIFPDELAEAERILVACSEAGVDAVLIQDLGLAALAHQCAPGLPVHASTQMTLTCAEAVHATDSLGLKVKRVVAPRENNLRELRRMVDGLDREVEVFVHGALCVAYSGQCLTSEALGGRSANRGECAQACRLPYDLVVDGETRDLGDLKYLLSPKDLMAAADVGELARMGIASLKIEGRLKTPEYVAATVEAYRRAVDRAMGGEWRTDPTPEELEQLEMTFSRGFTGGYLHETNHQAVVEGRFPKKRGKRLGVVEEVQRDGRIVIRLDGNLVHRPKAGDGIVFDAGRPDQEEAGGPIHGADELPDGPGDRRPVGSGGRMRLFMGRNWSGAHRVRAGNIVWKTSDPAIEKKLAASFSPNVVHHRRPVHCKATVGLQNTPYHNHLMLVWTDPFTGQSVTRWDEKPLEPARKQGLTETVLRMHLGKLATTPFYLDQLEVDPALAGYAVAPSTLNDLRRQAVERLIELRHRLHAGRQPARPGALEQWRAGHGTCRAAGPQSVATLSVLCRSLEQVEAVAGFSNLARIYVDLEDPRLLREARRLIPARGGPAFAPATLRIHKPGERGFLKLVLESNPDALLIRHLAGWHEAQRTCPSIPRIADHTLNVANDLTADLLLRRAKFDLLTPSYDLNMDQLGTLLARSDPAAFEVTIHQHMPMFHMEHCVFCRFLSTGTDYRDCGRPCEKHEVRLRDRLGYEHPVRADAGCRNTVYNATAQSASAYLPRLLELGVRAFRVDLVQESGAEARELVEAYQGALRGEREATDLWRKLRASSKLGVTRGTLDHD